MENSTIKNRLHDYAERQHALNMTQRMKEHNVDLLDFIQAAPCSFLMTAHQAHVLNKSGYERLYENSSWSLRVGGKYYVIRNDAALAAFRIPYLPIFGCITAPDMDPSFMVFASHCDSPALRIKPHADRKKDGYICLDVEQYGSARLSTWFDRPLSIAGRVCVRKDNGFVSVPFDLKQDLLIIPSLAVHMFRDGETSSAKISIQNEMAPMLSMENERGLIEAIADKLDVDPSDIVSYDLSCYVTQRGTVLGTNGEFISAPRLDDAMCVHASFQGFLHSEPKTSACVPIHLVFDNEEVGSCTRQGAASTFLSDIVNRICECFDINENEKQALLASSFMLSGDNGHAFHPNYPDVYDQQNKVRLGDGLVLKIAANQRYTTDAVSAAIAHMLAKSCYEEDGYEVPLIEWVNHSDFLGGATLGNIALGHVPFMTADIGAPQLSMHSAFETASAYDTMRLESLARALFESTISIGRNGEYMVRRAPTR